MSKLRTSIRRAAKAIRVLLTLENWPEVCAAVIRGMPLERIQTRRGTRITSPPTLQLWNHYNDIWYYKTYTSRYDVPVGGIVIDIGANIGIFSLLAAQRARIVYAFEPWPETFGYLEVNVRDRANIIPVMAAVSSTDGRRGMIPDRGLTASTLAPIGMEAGATMEVNCTTLSQVLDTFQIEHCDFLKLDCEGSEFEILYSLTDKELSTIGSLVLEYHDGPDCQRHTELAQFLRCAGFEVDVLPSAPGFGIMACQRVGV